MNYLLDTNIFYHLANRLIKFGQLPMIPPYKCYVSPLTILEIITSKNSYEYRKSAAACLLYFLNYGLLVLYDHEYSLAKHFGLSHLVDEEKNQNSLTQLVSYFYHFCVSYDEDESIREATTIIKSRFNEAIDKWMANAVVFKDIINLILSGKIEKNPRGSSLKKFEKLVSDVLPIVNEKAPQVFINRLMKSYSLDDIKAPSAIPNSIKHYVDYIIAFFIDMFRQGTKMKIQDYVDMEHLLYVNSNVDCIVTNDKRMIRLVKISG